MRVDAASDVQDMSICPGVRIEDMGHKMGCNGVDNGKLWFDGEHAVTTDAAAIAGTTLVKVAPYTQTHIICCKHCVRAYASAQCQQACGVSFTSQRGPLLQCRGAHS